MEKAGNSTLKTLTQLAELRTKRELNTQEIDELINLSFRLERSVAIQAEIAMSDLNIDQTPTVMAKYETDSVPPRRMTSGSAGFDIAAKTECKIKPGETCKVSTGIYLAIPDGYCGLLLSRSGLGINKSIVVAQGVGTIDSDYRGELIVPLYNRSNVEYIVNKHDRVAQLIVIPVVTNMSFTDDLDSTKRGTGGFGSTGITTEKTSTSERSENHYSSMDIPATC